MVSSRRYALVALVVSRKHPLASARSMLQPTTEPQPQETYQTGPSPTIAAVPHDHLAIFGRATSSPAQLHTCGYLYGDASIYLRRLLFLRYLFAIQGFRLLYNDKSMQIPDSMSPPRIFGSSKRRRLELYPILHHIDQYNDDDDAAAAATTTAKLIVNASGRHSGLAILGSAFMLLRRRRKKRAFSPTQQPFVSEYSYASAYPVSSVTESVPSTPFQAPGPAYSPSSVGHAHDGQHWSQVHEMPTGPPEREAHEMAT
ncbi:hypothetical protein E5D57_009751 [Metarhizium anisopliae]|nr:hypothetical protein E5D57_009751 [Metarhizium anisopliae]